MTPLGSDITRAGHVAMGADGTAWVLARARAAASSFPLEEGVAVPMPPPPQDATGSADLLYGISSTGRRQWARLIGHNLAPTDVASGGDSLFVVGALSSPSDVVHVAGPDSTYVRMASPDAGSGPAVFVMKHVPGP